MNKICDIWIKTVYKDFAGYAHVERLLTEWAMTHLHNTLPAACFPADRWLMTCVLCPMFYVWLKHLTVVVCVCACVRFPLTPVVLIKRVHAGEVDGEGLEGRRQADAALRSFHVEARRRARVGRLGQARLGILHAEYGSRRLGWLSAAPHGRSASPRKEESSKRSSHRI